jgi:hypothetical protein
MSLFNPPSSSSHSSLSSHKISFLHSEYSQEPQTARATQSSATKLVSALDTFKGSYCGGGEIPITTNPIIKSHSATSANGPLWAPPVTLRWDILNGSPRALTIKFSLPLSSIPPVPRFDARTEASASRTNFQPFDDLIKACAAATFGLDGKDVLDEQYRKAGKLDREQFSIDFHPADYGIVDTIAQTLLPGALTDIMTKRENHRGVLAELYKLNVSSELQEKNLLML